MADGWSLDDVQAQETPNPSTMKFTLPATLATPRGVALASLQEAVNLSELGAALFRHGGVERLYLGGDFVSVTKTDDQAWPMIVDSLRATIVDALATQPAAAADEAETYADDQPIFDPEDAELVAKIRDLIDERVRPVIEQDGGDIILRGFERGIVYMELRGACVGCPASSATLKMGVEALLRHYLPEVLEVRSVV